MTLDSIKEIWNDDLENMLTPEEQAIFFNLDNEEQDKYLAACDSYEAMKAYLEDLTSPPAAKRLLSLESWK